MRSLKTLALFAALIAGGLVAACDESTTPESRSDGGDAPADVSSDRTPDTKVPVDQAAPIDQAPVVDEAPPVDQGGFEMSQPAGCGTTAPGGGTACTVTAGVQCKYVNRTCPDGKPLERLCVCTGGKWSCIQDLGCPNSEPAGGTPEQKCGTCPAGPGASVCTYRIETCAAAEDLFNRCTCTNGTWSCSRDFDCYPPNTCRPENGGDNCVTNGLANTGNFCPPGYVQGACAAYPCKPGDPRRGCFPGTGNHPRSAACVYGQWACPIGDTVAFPLL